MRLVGEHGQIRKLLLIDIKIRDIETFINFKRARAQLRRVISKARQDSWDDYVGSIDSTTKSAEVWRKIRGIDKRAAPMRKVVLKEGNQYFYDEFQIANKCAKYYSNLSSAECNSHVISVRDNLQYSQVDNYNKGFSMHELRQALDHSKSSSPGPDFVPVDF